MARNITPQQRKINEKMFDIDLAVEAVKKRAAQKLGVGYVYDETGGQLAADVDTLFLQFLSLFDQLRMDWLIDFEKRNK